MSLKHIVDNCVGLEGPVITPLGSYYLEGPIFNGSCKIVDLSFLFSKAATVEFLLEVYNTGFNYEKFIMLCRFTNKTDDIFYKEALPFKRNQFDLLFDTVGKGESVETYLYNFSDTNNLDLGFMNFIYEIESI